MDLIVSDEYIQASATHIKNNFEKIDGILTKYVDALVLMRENVIQDGETAKALQAFIDYASLLRGNLTGIGENSQMLLKNMVLEIDNADKYLF